MRYLFSCWDVVADRIRQARSILLLVDYDGTLTPIVGSPELAALSSKTKSILQQLAKSPRLTLGIISGRAVEDLQKRVGIDGIIYTGNHGLEINGPDISFVNPTAKRIEPLLHSLSQDLSEALAGIRGAIIENKGLTLSLHYRLVDEEQLDELSKTFYSIISPLSTSGRIRISEGKKVYEVRPAVNWDKGRAIALIAQKLSGEGNPLTIFLGDDITDYNGFRLVNKNGGISIYVGEETPEPSAQYSLHSPEEVYQFLEMLRHALKS
jgi:trehalose-phosphatase